MKKLHIIIAISGLTLASIAIFAYAADLGNWGYKITGNTTIYRALDSSGNPPSGEPTPRSDIPEHGVVKEISNFSCSNNVFFPTKTSTEFMDWYKTSHSCYDIVDADPICSLTSNTCTLGNPINFVANDDLGCGYEKCASTDNGEGDTRYCKNGNKTSNLCVEKSYSCIYDIHCDWIQQQ